MYIDIATMNPTPLNSVKVTIKALNASSPIMGRYSHVNIHTWTEIAHDDINSSFIITLMDSSHSMG